MMPHLIARACSPLLAFADKRPRGDNLRIVQHHILSHIVSKLSSCEIGKQNGFDKLPDDHRLRDAFRATVAERTYQDHAALITRVAAGERDVLFPGKCLALAQTSGTTSNVAAGERYVPQNAALLRHHQRGGAAAFSRLIKATGGGIFSGNLLMLGGSTALEKNSAGIPCGDLSGIIAQRIPRWIQPLYEPGLDIALDNNWERKLGRITERCAQRDIRLVSGIPAWMLMLFQRLCAHRNLSRVRTVWPNLKGFIYGGHGIDPFLPSLREHLSPDTWMMEVYPASEAFIAIGSRPWQIQERQAPPLDILAQHGVYIEFAPVDGGPTVGPELIQADVIYRVLITTPAGLIRYQLGDLVSGVAPGQVRFAGRVKTRISVFGEHVEGAHLDAAITKACHITKSMVHYYHVAPILPRPDNPAGQHEWLVEFQSEPPNHHSFIATIDHHLRSQVLDYDAHRNGGQLHAPVLRVLPRGSFHTYLKQQGKLGGQHKIPQAWSDRSIAEKIIAAESAGAHHVSLH
jgi:GH3 auxin-responsive promoter